MTPDSQLLTEYAVDHDEAAFSELMRRHLDHVYRTALRVVGGDAHLGQDIAQAVFIELARNARSLSDRPFISGWLHTTTRFLASKAVRAERRRRQREQATISMHLNSSSEPNWDQVRAFLDDAIEELSGPERDALMLRYFEKKHWMEVGLVLGISGDAARMRVGRAVSNLRARLAQKGIVSSFLAVAELLAAESSSQAPIGLASRIRSHVDKEIALLRTDGLKSGRRLPLGRVGILYTVGIISLTLMAVYSVRHRPKPSARLMSDFVSGARVQRSQLVTPSRARIASDTAKKTVVTVLAERTGEPVVEAKLNVKFFGAGNDSETQEAMTDWTGIANLAGPTDRSKNLRTTIHVLAPGYVPVSVRLTGRLPESYTVRLDPARCAAGRIVDLGGAPVPGVKVGLEVFDYDKERAQNVDFRLLDMLTDELGKWSCPCVPPTYDRLRFVLTRDDYAVSFADFYADQVVLTNLVFVMRNGFVVEGRVVDSLNRPLARAKVREIGPYRRRMAVTDDEGRFLFTGAGQWQGFEDGIPERTPSGESIVRSASAIGEPWIQVVVQADGFGAKNVSIALSAPTNAVFVQLSPGNVLVGCVTDEDGNPIAGAVIQTDSGLMRARTYRWRTETDSNGNFVWDAAPEELVWIWVEASGYVPVRDLRLVPDGTAHSIRLKRVGFATAPETW